MKQKVVIIGHGWLSRLSLIRSVAEAGCEVTVVVMTLPFSPHRLPKKPIDCFSKYVSKYYHCVRKDKESLISLLIDKCSDPMQKVILIPDGDDVVSNIDNHKDQLKKFFVFPYIADDPSSVDYWMDKSNQKKIAKDIGLNVADDTVIEVEDGQYTIPEDIHYPCFPKPLATQNGGKGGMKCCNNQKELEGAIGFLVNNRSRDIKVMVEEFKHIDTEYAVLGFSDGQNVVIPGIIQFLAASKAHTGIALQGKVRPVDGFETVVEQFRQLVAKIGFVGLFDIDFYKSEGTIYFCEMNLRYGGSGDAITKMGVNLPSMLVKHFSGESVAGMKKAIDEEAVFVNDRMDFDDLNSGFIGFSEYRNYIKSSQIRFISDADDSCPEKAFKKEFRKRIPINLVKRAVRKR